MIPVWLVTAHALLALTAAGAPQAFSPAYVAGQNTVIVTSIQQARAITGHPEAVVADIEHWSLTPSWQQQHPFRTVRRICAIAHSLGALCIAAPSADLAGGWRAYLRHHLAWTARHADVLEVQSQTQELHPYRFARWVDKARRQAKSVNPQVKVWAGLTTSTRLGNVTGRALWRAYSSVTVAGWWLNVPSAGPACPTCGKANPRPAVWLLDRIYGVAS